MLGISVTLSTSEEEVAPDIPGFMLKSSTGEGDKAELNSFNPSSTVEGGEATKDSATAGQIKDSSGMDFVQVWQTMRN